MMQSSQCNDCGLYGEPKVTGSGNVISPTIAFVGEAPGKDEVRENTPFIGMAGRIVRGVLEYLQIPEEETYFTNACICRPPENRTPTAKEIKSCYPRLKQEIECVDPVYLVALGATAGRTLFPGYRSMNNMRGTLRQTNLDRWGIVTFHPAAVLYGKSDTLLPFIISDVAKVWRKATGEKLPYSDLETKTTVVDHPQKVADFIRHVRDTSPEIIFYDWETTGLNPLVDRGFCLAVSVQPGESFVFPVEIVNKFGEDLTELFRHYKTAAFNCMFDDDFNELETLQINARLDPMLMHYCIDERPQRRNLETLSGEFCDAPPYESEMLEKYKTTKAKMIEEIPPEAIYEYAGKDTDYGLRLTHILQGELDKTPSLWRVHNELLIPATRVYREIQRNGFYVDQFALSNTEQEFGYKINQSRERLQDIVGNKEFNPNSHPQVQEFLWDTLGLEEPNLYNRKARSADKETRKSLLEVYPSEEFIQELHTYKDLYTLWSRYLRGLSKYIHPDGRIRCSYHLDRTETGRRSTTDPALQQLPRESVIRQVMSVPDGCMLIQGDYEQGEMRMAAHIAQDRNLARYLMAEDFHSQMASQAFRIPIDEVTPQQRQAAKAVSFGVLYQMSIKSLALGTGLSFTDAKRFVKEYTELMPDVMRWIEQTKEQVKSQRYVESPFGRRRRFPLLTKSNLAGLQREAVNMPIQSGLADLTLWALIQWSQFCNKHFPQVVMIVFEGHDAILTEAPEDIALDVAKEKKRIMEKTPFDTFVEFPVEVKVGKAWGIGEKIAC